MSSGNNNSVTPQPSLVTSSGENSVPSGSARFSLSAWHCTTVPVCQAHSCGPDLYSRRQLRASNMAALVIPLSKHSSAVKSRMNSGDFHESSSPMISIFCFIHHCFKSFCGGLISCAISMFLKFVYYLS